MKSRDLSLCILIARSVSIFKTTGTIPNTEKIRDDRPAPVARARIPSMPHGNPLLPSLITPFIGAFL